MRVHVCECVCIHLCCHMAVVKIAQSVNVRCAYVCVSVLMYVCVCVMSCVYCHVAVVKIEQSVGVYVCECVYVCVCV